VGPAIWLGALVVILLLNTAASIRVPRSDFLALQITTDPTRGPRAGQSSGVEIGYPVDVALGTDGVSSFGGGSHGAEVGHGGVGGSFGDGGAGGGH
jgi:hypothetical protein